MAVLATESDANVTKAPAVFVALQYNGTIPMRILCPQPPSLFLLAAPPIAAPHSDLRWPP